ncbi:glycoside hydrolase family 88 protein [Aliifodinibius salicampi]|uniref:Glycoside hydrolase family 88 protein n=1 Tax=Fodinibius salicampi TaxID=1920655 RepID=A0ABT3Q124_9BACT|nr:glycoside hydrolase family 88 protein [Fodinibius salicampi]MCW9713748.1 glycoside hydrolase family 88 protein [Fodinibius salicampi]
MKIKDDLVAEDLQELLNRFWKLSGQKIRLIRDEYDTAKGSPVFTKRGKYTSRGWTEWTQGFQFGSEILQYDVTDDTEFLDMAREATINEMAPHITHIGVHDHGFNNVSTYGALRRLSHEGRIEADKWENEFYDLALKSTGAVQAARWTTTEDGEGFIHSFNGPHSLFVDTVRTLRALAISHQLGHTLYGEHDEPISLLERLIQHARKTARYNIYYGSTDAPYDIRGRTAHESVFNVTDGQYRCPNSQQGYSPFSTWTRGLAWAMCGFAEQLEWLETIDDEELEPFGGRSAIEKMMLEAAKATCDFYIDHTSLDGIPYWDTGAPQLHKLGDYTQVPADPYNDFEPVDSSAAAIGAQGLLRLGHYLNTNNEQEDGSRYWQAGLTVGRTLLDEPYLSTDESHQGLLLHSVYHRPNGWDYIPEGQSIPCGESSMWGDYHMRELALYLTRIYNEAPYYTFFNGIKSEV